MSAWDTMVVDDGSKVCDTGTKCPSCSGMVVQKLTKIVYEFRYEIVAVEVPSEPVYYCIGCKLIYVAPPPD